MRRALVLLVSSCLCSAVAAQCSGVWQSSAGWDAPFTSSVTLPNGDLVVGGAFTSAEGVPCSYVARKHGSIWSAVGVPPGPVASLAVTANGELLAGHANGVVQWNGAAWVSLGALAPQGAVNCLAALPNGEVFAAWRFQSPPGSGPWFGETARWTGSAWVPAPFDVPYRANTAFAVDSTGTLHSLVYSVIGGFSPQLYKWSGAWVAETLLFGGPSCLAALPNGDIAVASPGVSRWNGSTLTALPSAPNGGVFAMTTLPDGDLVAGGMFTTPAANIARWDGSSWSPLGTGVVGEVRQIAVDPDGNIVVSGPITSAGGVAAQHVARYATTCPVAATTFMTGCPTSVGNAQWSVEVGPWVGATYRASCSGLPALSIAVDVIGVLTNPVPLDTLLPGAGVPGCSLVPDPLILETRTVINGVATSTLALPALPWLVGIAFHHQMIPFEFDASSNLIGVTGTDTLQLTIGSL